MMLFKKKRLQQENDERKRLEQLQKEITEAAVKQAAAETEAKFLQDPVFKAAYEAQSKYNLQQEELRQVLDFGLTERVLRRLCENAVLQDVTVTIRFPVKADGRGGEEVFITPRERYEELKKKVERTQLPF